MFQNTMHSMIYLAAFLVLPNIFTSSVLAQDGLPDDVKTADEKYRAMLDKNHTDCMAAHAKLKEILLKNLESAMAENQQAGKLEETLMVKRRIEELKARPDINLKESDPKFEVFFGKLNEINAEKSKRDLKNTSSYIAYLKRKVAAATKAGDLDVAVAINTHMKRVENGEKPVVAASNPKNITVPVTKNDEVPVTKGETASPPKVLSDVMQRSHIPTRGLKEYWRGKLRERWGRELGAWIDLTVVNDTLQESVVAKRSHIQYKDGKLREVFNKATGAWIDLTVVNDTLQESIVSGKGHIQYKDGKLREVFDNATGAWIDLTELQNFRQKKAK